MLTISVYAISPHRLDAQKVRPYLSPVREAYCNRLRQPEDRARAQGASLAASCALAGALGLPYPAAHPLALEKTPLGAPILPDYPALRISMAHAGEWAVCALADLRSETEPLTPRLQIGVDLESTGRVSLRAIRRVSPKGEISPEEEKNSCAETCTRLWTRRESVLKACGTGFALPFRDFSVRESLCRLPHTALSPDAPPGCAALRSFLFPTPAYCLSLALLCIGGMPPPFQIRFYTVCPEPPYSSIQQCPQEYT